MEDPNYKEPEPCIGLTCPLTGEQYYVDKKDAIAYTKKKHTHKRNAIAHQRKKIHYYTLYNFNIIL